MIRRPASPSGTKSTFHALSGLPPATSAARSGTWGHTTQEATDSGKGPELLYGERDFARVQDEREAPNSERSGFRRDFGRLLHSPAFRRLQGKTQLFPGHESDFYRNRLTHSLEVAQIAKGIALSINASSPLFKETPIDLDLVEFAGLAHDLGHPPFGHNGEHALNDCMGKSGGFEGNAQTLRILSRVEKKMLVDGAGEFDPCGIREDGLDRRLGLNLTFRSLASILKYDEEIPLRRADAPGSDRGYYASEAELIRLVKSHVGNGGRWFKTLECQIMDIADDIAYSTYDLEDAMKGGFTHPLELVARVKEDRRLFDTLLEKLGRDVAAPVTKREVCLVLDGLWQASGSNPFKEFNASRRVADDAYLRCRFTSRLVRELMKGVSVRAPVDGNLKFAQIEVERDVLLKIQTLKHLNYLLVIMSPRLRILEHRGYEIVKTLFQTLDAPNGHLLLPDDLRAMHSRLPDADSRKRLICDFIAGMTDRYAMEFYSRLIPECVNPHCSSLECRNRASGSRGGGLRAELKTVA